MANKKKNDNRALVAIGIVVAIAVVVALGIFISGPGIQRVIPNQPLSPEDARAKLEGKLPRFERNHVRQVTPPTDTASIAATLPAINEYPIVAGQNARSLAAVEIFVSSEKSGAGDDSWMLTAAEEFNKSGRTTSQGHRALARIRKIASGTAYQYVWSGKHVPQAYSPSNLLWIEMAKARGAELTPILEKTVGNVAGIVMKKDLAEQFRAQGPLTVPAIIDGVVQKRIVLGYTDPYVSSTGLNFLVTVLAHFAGGDPAKVLSDEATSALQVFQESVPFIALTTLQMRESVRRGGSLDAFVMEWQTFTNIAELTRDYEFIPFGWPHDNPLYATENVSAAQQETLDAFGEFLASQDQQRAAGRMGFNPSISHSAPMALPDGGTLLNAQEIWKQHKDGGRTIAAMFVADVSGSMSGTRILGLRTALIEGSSFIDPANAIGLIQFSDKVDELVPIAQFDDLQKARFQTAVKRLRSGGGTAMYDAVAVALDLLLKYRDQNPDVRPMIFVLTDGETKNGMVYGDMEDCICGLRIPIHTIGFEANIGELQRLSGCVEAASIQANSDNVRFKISSMFNSQM